MLRSKFCCLRVKHVLITRLCLQVMPQLLNSLCVDSTGASIDWGTLVVYTCSDSCNHDDQYCQEFIWKQDFSSDQHAQSETQKWAVYLVEVSPRADWNELLPNEMVSCIFLETIRKCVHRETFTLSCRERTYIIFILNINILYTFN